MSYATLPDLRARFGEDELVQLSDRAGGMAIDVGVVDRALADADAEIDVYLASRYALPLASVPAAIVRIACDIARYRLWADRASEEVRRRYEDARRMLERVASGEVVLAQPGPDSPPPAAGTLAVMLKASHPAMRYHRAGRVFVRGVPQEVAVSHEDAERLLADAHLLVTRQEE